MERRDIAESDGRYGFREMIASLDRYDFLLAVIPAAFLAAILVATTLGVSLETAVVGASFVGLLALFDGLFFRPPSGLQGV